MYTHTLTMNAIYCIYMCYAVSSVCSSIIMDVTQFGLTLVDSNLDSSQHPIIYYIAMFYSMTLMACHI